MWRMGSISLVVHILILGVWGWRFSFSKPPMSTPLVVELKNIQDITQAPRLGKVVDKNAEKKPDVTPTSEPAAHVDVEHSEQPKEEAKPEPVAEEAKTDPKPEPKPAEAKPEPKDELKKAPIEKPKKKEPEKKKPEPPKAKEKPKPKKEKDKPKKPEKAAVQLKKGKKDGDKKVRNKKQTSQDAKNALDNLLNEASDSGAPNVGETLSASHVDALRSAIKQCWAVPAGLLDARNIAVEVHIELNPDGTVLSASIVDQARLAKDPNFKIAADAAYRAVVDPACQPFPLPKDRYGVWKEIDITFDAHSMFG